MTCRFKVLILLIILFYGCNEHKVSFSNEIKPLLNKRCAECHGGIKNQGDLNLMTFEKAFLPSPKTGKPRIIKGSAENSDLYQRIISKDPDYFMPRDHAPLPSEEVEIIKNWIDQGAIWEDHWAYLPFDQPSVPNIQNSWPETEIDNFIYQKLQELEIEPNHSIENDKLIRRLSLDLTGLPPNTELAVKFLNDNISYEELVDSLLNKSSYGEHWASMWLDLARYADSKGYEKDPHRNIWRYREWVIKALNHDLPFDEFTLDQLAGDIIDPSDPDRLIATAFHRNSMTNTEGGTDDEEFRVASVVDRLNTTFEIWMGTTLACAQCHDHPYDPISQKEFFQSMSLLNNTMDADLSGEFPVLESYSSKTKEEIDEIVKFISLIEDKEIQDHLSTTEKIKASIHPILLPRDCDDFYNMLIFPDGIMSNWTNNVNDMKGRKFYFMYSNIDFDSLQAIEASYATSGEEAEIILFLDSLQGPKIFQSGFQKTKSISGHEWSGRHEWKMLNMEIPPDIQGKHDVIFEIINPSLKVPEGIVLFQKFELIYKNYISDKNLEKKKNELINYRTLAETTPILREKSSKLQRSNHIHERGNHRTKGEIVQSNLPEILKWEKGKIANRHEFAQWLVDESNPLTSRVIVNRIWANIFGTGIVRTLEDFGSQGEPPSHPELLDYLAYRFIHFHKWSLKGLIKEIVSSKTYKQSTIANSEKIAKDPFNYFLSRGPRKRLSSEQIRDQALKLSGLLFDSIGGPSVMPPQPEGIWQTVYNNSNWKTSDNNHKYRRGIYTYWKRSSPYPSMETFDSPTREVCRSTRIVTNTPNQALVTLNDPVYIEAANALGHSMEQYSLDKEKRIEYLYQKCFFTRPNPKIKNQLLELYNKADNKLLESDEQSNTSLESPSAVVAHAILNLDAFLNKS